MSNPAFTPIPDDQMEWIMKMESIFFPVARRQREKHYNAQPSSLRADPAKFVHYTSADAALKIISSKSMWMRNTLAMVDYREVQHGFDILQSFFVEPANMQEFTDALDATHPGVAQQAVTHFDQQWPTIRAHTYIASISEHYSSEDYHGRLSMWRAFGGNVPRVAIVFKLPWETTGGIALNLLFSPAAYLAKAEAHAVIREVIANIKGNVAFLGNQDRNTVVRYIFEMLLAAVTCLKHEGFLEEREWRAIYSPFLNPSALMQPSTQVVSGTPQVVYSIPLDKAVDAVLSELDFARIFDRLIIGPTPYGFPIQEALVAELKKAGVAPATAENSVFISGIPIRA